MRTRSVTRRRGRLIALLAVTLVTLVSQVGAAVVAPIAAAQSDAATNDAGVVPILQVNGLLDPIVADFLIGAIERANNPAQDSRAIVLLVNSTGSVLDDDQLDELAIAIDESAVPVAAWVGPSNARALGHVAQLVGLAERVGVAPGARLGETGPQVLDPDRFGTVWGDNAPQLLNRSLDHEQVRELGIAEFEAPIIGEFLVGLTSLGLEASATDDGGTRLDTIPRFEGLSIFYDWMHTVASPPVAYLLFIIGLALFVFEYYTAGVGVAGILGAGCFLLGCFGLGMLPTRPWAIVLLVLSMLAFAVDVQTNVPRFWTVVGMILFVIGTFALFDGVSMSWITIGVGIIGIALTFIVGMPTMVRTRFSTPTIGRTWMVGELGVAVDAVQPDGLVTIRDAVWKARTNRATPIHAGDPVRVVAIDGLILEVEPEEGGAKDYRNRG